MEGCMKVPLLDLKAQYKDIKDDIADALERVLESQRFILGGEVESLEAAIAEKLRVKHAVGVASGTDALLLSLRAVGVGPGDEVITTPFTFFATAGTIWNLGAKPVFVDIEPAGFNLNPDLVQAKVTPRTKAVITVHLFGQCARISPLLELAKDRGIAVIEDAAQGIGSTHTLEKDAGDLAAGTHAAGTMGTAGTLSFFPSKNLGAYGDGGMVLTRNDDVGDKIKLLRVHGSRPKYYHKVVGFNSRLDALQAAILSAKLAYLDRWTEGRREKARAYDKLFEGSPVKTPVIESGNTHIFHQYTIRVPRRDDLRSHLASKDIGAEIYYPVPLHLQECFQSLGYREGDLPESERAAKECMSLPVYPELTVEQQEYVAAAVLEFVSQG
jgi:dTDP-4-amino-4,6-dideoxygalactose transaminase